MPKYDYDPDEMLASSIQFALQQYRYKPRPRFDNDPNERERYYSHVATAIRNQIKLTWIFVRKSDGGKAE